jgi:uncharacterized alkaline shock family protein YloU
MIGGGTDISDEVVEAITEEAALEVDGVVDLVRMPMPVHCSMPGPFRRGRGMAKAVFVEVGRKEAIVDLGIEVMYGFSIPQIIIDERRKIGARLLELTGLVAKEINVHVEKWRRSCFPRSREAMMNPCRILSSMLCPCPPGHSRHNWTKKRH